MELIKKLYNPPEVQDAQRLAESLVDDPLVAERVMELLGSTEAYGPVYRPQPQQLSLGMEGFKETLMATLERIYNSLMDILSEITHAAEMMGDGTAMLGLRVEQLRNKAKALHRGHTTATFKVETRVQNLCVRYIPIKDVGQLLVNLRNLSGVVNAYYSTQNEHVIRPSMTLAQDITNGVSLDDLIVRVLGGSPVGIATSHGQWFQQDGDQFKSYHLMGNHQLVITAPSSDDRYEVLHNTKVHLNTSEQHPRPIPTHIDFQYFNVPTTVSLLDRVDQILATLTKHNSLNTRMRRKERLRVLANVIKQMQTKIASDDTGGRSLDECNRIVRIVEDYVDWLVNPYLGFYALTSRNLTAALNVCELNLK